MLVIRLQRTGRENNPTYRIVVAEKDAAVKGRFLEVIGHYLPTRDPIELLFNEERVKHWVSKGATPSDTISRLLTKAGVKGLEKFTTRYTKKRSKSAEPEEVAAPVKPAPAPTPEAPKAEEAAPAVSEEPAAA